VRAWLTAAVTAGARGWVTATAAAWVEAKAKARVSATASAMAVATAAARVASAGVGDSGGDGCSKRGRYPRDAARVTKLDYFGTYLRYLPTNPT
jgi:hypothetical protein